MLAQGNLPAGDALQSGSGSGGGGHLPQKKVTGVTVYPFSFEYSEKIEEFFKEVPIFLKHFNVIDGVFKNGEQIRLVNPVLIEPFATMPKRGFFSMGAFSYCLSALPQSTQAGRYCSISSGNTVLGIDHPTDRIGTHVFTFRRYFTDDIRQRFGRAPKPVPFEADHGPLIIGNDVWIGQDVMIKSGVRIGSGSVVAAGSIVTKDVPPFAIVAGVPARILRYRFPEALQERVLRVQWWNYHVCDFDGLPTDRPVAFLDGIEERIAAGRIKPYVPERIDLAAAIARLARV